MSERLTAERLAQIRAAFFAGPTWYGEYLNGLSARDSIAVLAELDAVTRERDDARANADKWRRRAIEEITDGAPLDA